MTDSKIYYASIGNSDDLLPQAEWARFVGITFGTVQRWAREVYGMWYSAPDSSYQNACIGFELADRDVSALKVALIELRQRYSQRAVAWAEVRETEMI